MVPIPNFVMAPGVKVYIATERNGIIDVSDDLVDGEMIRRSDGVSSFRFSLQNVRRKYDGILSPNDRVAVQMKRLKWVQVYTGYLNKVPLVTAWPRVVHLTSSCSLKRLQYWYWDSHAEASQMMVRQALEDAGKESGVSDGGMTNVALTVLKKVVGWPASKVHITKIPGNWYGVVETLAKQIDAELDEADKVARALYDSLGPASVGSGGAGGDASSLTGKYGGFNSSEQKSNAATIYTVGKQKGGSTRDCIIAIMTAMQESGLNNLDHGDRDSVGLFQQRPSQGWGTRAEIMTPSYAAGKFFEALFKIKGRNSMELWEVCQAVQRSGHPRAYEKHEKPATAMVKDLEKGGGSEAEGASLDSKPQGTSSGLAFAQMGVNFCKKYPNIPYTQKYGGTQMAVLSKNPPPGLDCSSFVQSMYLRTMGSLYNVPRVASAQYAFCKPVSVAKALKTPGALVFKGGSPGSIHHVEVSLGDGKNTVGAHSSRANPQVGVGPALPASYWDYGGFLPRLAYTTGAGSVIFEGTDGTEGALPSDIQVVELVTGADAPGYNPKDPFDKMFGDNAWLPISTAENDPNYAMAQMLAGPRALLNDQPLLPYLKNLFNSTMRSFCSAPNGDLIAWYPDYYGMWGAAAKMVIQPIEVQDFEVSWSDDYMVTHQYVVTSPQGSTNTFDPSTGTAQSITQDYLATAAIFTTGVVSIDFPGVWKALFGMDMTEKQAKKYADDIKKRFGARPDYQQLPGLVGPKAALFAAIFLFMRQFAYQYQASVPLTFMPELYPGMIIQIPEFNFQAYVTTVTHSFKFGPDGYFNTSVQIAAPARLTGDKKLLGLPMAGGA
ncbi:C40 family peptidase [Streptomyces sp. V3I8]|uniref:C40 family peptidase n=1 Tax=Streptomyces sp. V3I8 TaxID=3042279 RepID=UPI0027D7799C|nr:NlpC/P60 family protein [Streptomyces sp. V3I8]